VSGPGNFSEDPPDVSGVTLETFIGRAFRAGISIPLLVVAVLFAVGAPWIYYNIETGRVTQQAQSTSELVEARLSSLISSLEAVATLEGYSSEPSADATARRLETAMAYSPSYVEFGFVNASGRVVATVPAFVNSKSRVEGAVGTAFDWIKENSAVYRGSPHSVQRLGDAVVLVAVRVTTPHNEFAGMVWGRFNLSPIKDVIADINKGRHENVYILDSDGFVIVHPDEWRVTAKQQVSSPRDGLTKGIDGFALMGVGELKLSDETLTIVFEHDLSGFAAFLALALVPLLVVIAMLRISRTAQRRLTTNLRQGLTRPAQILEASVRGYDAGDTEIPEPTSEILELRSLADAFGGAIRRVERSREALAASNRDLERFASIAAHDLKEPLRKVQMFGDRLAMALGDDLRPEVDLPLGRMVDGANRMSLLIDDILKYSQISSRMRVFEPTILSDVVARVVNGFEPSLIETSGRVDVGYLPTIDADSAQMRQLFQNLISNSLKYARPDVAPIVSIDSTIENIHGRPMCRIVVTDNGIGFDQDRAEEIFEVFTRLVGRSEFSGTGIGLAICRRIVERHGGTIRARGFPGEGSEFEVVLAIHQVSQNTESVSRSADADAVPPTDVLKASAESKSERYA